jgi:hypothetical protein
MRPVCGLHWEDNPLLPDHLKPWAQLLPDSWPTDAGSIPDERAVAQAFELGAPPGAKVGLAWVMFCRPQGASRAEIIAACGAPQFNRARDTQRAGRLDFMIGSRSDGRSAYFLGPPGSHPGGPSAVPAGKPESFSEFKKLRNEIAHGHLRRDPAALAERLSEFSISDSELPELACTRFG